MPDKDGTGPKGGGKRGKRGGRRSGKTPATSNKKTGMPGSPSCDISSATLLKPTGDASPGRAGGKKRCGQRIDEFSNPEWWK